ncbi:hypothetical protein PG985_012565 [Apiospora marii]|uniref:uncharacterized protein n=1 Tax=Apiospora marii TaxID=335849 RepID=UPI00313004BC
MQLPYCQPFGHLTATLFTYQDIPRVHESRRLAVGQMYPISVLHGFNELWPSSPRAAATQARPYTLQHGNMALCVKEEVVGYHDEVHEQLQEFVGCGLGGDVESCGKHQIYRQGKGGMRLDTGREWDDELPVYR